MFNKKILLPLFILMAIAQWAIPLQMISGNETVLDQGRAFKFKTAPVDPNDPLRGKYIRLRFDADEIEVDTLQEWAVGEQVFVYLDTDADGFAKIDKVDKYADLNNPDVVRSKIRHQYKQQNGTRKLTIEYPFNRFYMEESKAYEAEILYREARRDSSTLAYALVYVDKGDVVLKEVFVNDVPIKEAVKARRKEQ